jgi:hypothetical protein
MEVSLEVNVEKTKYTFLSRYQNIGQNPDINTAKKSLEKKPLKYLGKTVTNQNFIQRKKRLNSGNAFTIRFRTFSHLLCFQKFKNYIIQDYSFALVLHGCET